MRTAVKTLGPAVGAVDRAAADVLAEREVGVPAPSTEVHALAAIDQLQCHESTTLKASADDVPIGGVPRVGGSHHASQLEVHRAGAGCLNAGAIGTDCHPLFMSA